LAQNKSWYRASYPSFVDRQSMYMSSKVLGEPRNARYVTKVIVC
jgi:hypothetical protein